MLEPLYSTNPGALQWFQCFSDLPQICPNFYFTSLSIIPNLILSYYLHYIPFTNFLDSFRPSVHLCCPQMHQLNSAKKHHSKFATYSKTPLWLRNKRWLVGKFSFQPIAPSKGYNYSFLCLTYNHKAYSFKSSCKCRRHKKYWTVFVTLFLANVKSYRLGHTMF